MGICSEIFQDIDSKEPTVSATGAGAASQSLPANRYLQPVRVCQAYLDGLLAELQVDPWPVPQAHRPVRATGTALAISVCLLEVCLTADPLCYFCLSFFQVLFLVHSPRCTFFKGLKLLTLQIHTIFNRYSILLFSFISSEIIHVT